MTTIFTNIFTRNLNQKNELSQSAKADKDYSESDKTANVSETSEYEDDTQNNDEYGFNKKSSNKGENILIGSLIALSVLTVPTLEILDDSDRHTQNFSYYSKPDKEEMVCNPTALAKGGENDSIIELQELMDIIDFSSIEGLPKSKQEAIKMVAMANLTPVKSTSKDAESKVIKQIKHVQEWVDKAAKKAITNPSQSPDEKLNDYRRKYITHEEILGFVDFSELQKYQKDITVLEALARNSMPKIERTDINAYEKIQNTAENIQKLVDRLAVKHKYYSKVAGNADNDNTLSDKEFLNLLDKASLDGISPEKQREIIKKSVKGYNPIMFSHIDSSKDTKNVNKEILKKVQAAQNILDREADRIKYEEFKRNNNL